jgi:hypothetical protein
MMVRYQSDNILLHCTHTDVIQHDFNEEDVGVESEIKLTLVSTFGNFAIIR